MPTALDPLQLLELSPLRAQMPVTDARQTWPNPTRSGSWVDPVTGVTWRRRGDAATIKRLVTLVRRGDVPVLLLYSFDVHEVPRELLEPALATLTAYWHSADHLSLDGAEFVDGSGDRRVLLQVTC